MKDGLVVVAVLGKDRIGLVGSITEKIADVNCNIVDIEQSVIRGLFSMFMLVDLEESTVDYKKFSDILINCSKGLGVDITLTPFSESRK
jgi:predicted amino acid-binding ACT domain protein